MSNVDGNVPLLSKKRSASINIELKIEDTSTADWFKQSAHDAICIQCTEKNILNCKSWLRLKNILSSYKTFMLSKETIDNHTDSIQEILSSFNFSITQLLDLWIHLVNVHKIGSDGKHMKIIRNQKDINCAITNHNCLIYLGCGRWDNMNQSGPIFSGNHEEAVLLNVFDSMHYHLFHTISSNAHDEYVLTEEKNDHKSYRNHRMLKYILTNKLKNTEEKQHVEIKEKEFINYSYGIKFK
eukprot:74972_1